MKKINYKILLVTCIVTLLPIVLGSIFYNKLPDTVAIHFDINNNPNRYFSKNAFVFGMPVLMVALQLFLCVISDVADKYPEANRKMMIVGKWIIPILSIILYIVTIMYAIGNKLDIRKIVMFILGVLFVIMGNYLPKTKGNINLINKIFEQEYKKVSRISGYLMILNGLLFLASNLFSQYVSIFVVCLAILEIIVLCAYTIIKSKD